MRAKRARQLALIARQMIADGRYRPEDYKALVRHLKREWKKHGNHWIAYDLEPMRLK